MAKKRKVRTRRVIRRTKAQLITELNGQMKARGHERIEYAKAMNNLRMALDELRAERQRFNGSENEGHLLRDTELRLLRDYHRLAVDVLDEQKARSRGHDGMMGSSPRMSQKEINDLSPENWMGRQCGS